MKFPEGPFFSNPEGQKEPESKPDLQVERFVWYNRSTTLEGLMSETERAKYEQNVDLEFIEKNSNDWKKYLLEKVNVNDVILLGEAHTAEIVEKEAVTEFLEQAKEKGVTDIGFEIQERLQEYLDHFLETGKFQEREMTPQITRKFPNTKDYSVNVKLGLTSNLLKPCLNF